MNFQMNLKKLILFGIFLALLTSCGKLTLRTPEANNKIQPTQQVEALTPKETAIVYTEIPTKETAIVSTEITTLIQPTPSLQVNVSPLAGCQIGIIPLVINEYPSNNKGMKNVDIYFAIDVISSEYGLQTFCSDDSLFTFHGYVIENSSYLSTTLRTVEGYEYSLGSWNYLGSPQVVIPNMRYRRIEITDIWHNPERSNIFTFEVAENATPKELIIFGSSYDLSNLPKFNLKLVENEYPYEDSASKDNMADKIPAGIFSFGEKIEFDTIPYKFVFRDLEVTIQSVSVKKGEYIFNVQYKNLNAGYPIHQASLSYSLLGDNGILINNQGYFKDSTCSTENWLEQNFQSFNLGPNQTCNEIVPFSIKNVNNTKLIIAYNSKGEQDQAAHNYNEVRVINLPNLNK